MKYHILALTLLAACMAPAQDLKTLTPITWANISDADYLPLIDVSANGLKGATIPEIGKKLGVNRPIVFEGDSLTDSTALAAPYTWPSQLVGINAVWKGYDYHNVATSGNTVVQMLAQYTTQVAPVKPATPKTGLAFLLAGTNDIAAGASAATIYSNLQAWWALARADGFVTTVLTVPKSTTFTVANGKEPIRLALNALILANANLYDFSVNLDDLLTNNQTSDGTHFLTSGHAEIARMVNATLSQTLVPAKGPRLSWLYQAQTLYLNGKVQYGGTGTFDLVAETAANVVPAGNGVAGIALTVTPNNGTNNSAQITIPNSDVVRFGRRIKITSWWTARVNNSAVAGNLVVTQSMQMINGLNNSAATFSEYAEDDKTIAIGANSSVVFKVESILISPGQPDYGFVVQVGRRGTSGTPETYSDPVLLRQVLVESL